MKEVKTIYIAGAVTSDIKENGYLKCYQKFEQAEKTITKCFPYAKIYNPMKICKAEWSWLRCMIVCLWVLIFKCDTAIFLDDYKKSKGAMIEFKTAVLFKKRIEMLGQMIAEIERAKSIKINSIFQSWGLPRLSKYYVEKINTNGKEN